MSSATAISESIPLSNSLCFRFHSIHPFSSEAFVSVCSTKRFHAVMTFSSL